MNQKILYIILPVILVLGIYGSQTSYEKSGYFQPLNVKKSNNIMTLSIDNSEYEQGQTINVYGQVTNSGEGVSVLIKVIDPSNKTAGDFHGVVNRFGIFSVFYVIPDSLPSGKYTLKAYYEGDQNKTTLSLDVNISNTPNGEYRILIPYGASVEGNKLNFHPSPVTILQGTEIVWVNNDATVHTVISGKVNPDGTLFLDDRFQGGYVSPGASLLVSPNSGNYTYFCKIHPWLGGAIYVKLNPLTKPTTPVPAKPTTPVPAKPTTPVPAKPTTPVPAKPTTPTVSNDILTSIWKERKDLQNAFPEAAKGNLTNLKKWATTTGWNEDKRLAVLVPPGKVPLYLQKSSFPVSDSVLLSIWQDRKDLQKTLPEVAKGNLTNLKNWATIHGWNEEKSLAVLVPQGKIPKYVDDVLLSIWKERNDLQKSYPEVAKGNLTNLKTWATTTGWNEDKRLSALIPPGKVPSYLQKPQFPVSNSTLLSIWKESSDLQIWFPEVAQGNFENLQNWASTTGWDLDPRLAALIPPGKVPTYPQNSLVNETSFGSSVSFMSIVPILVIAVIAAVGGILGYIFYNNRKKIRT